MQPYDDEDQSMRKSYLVPFIGGLAVLLMTELVIVFGPAPSGIAQTPAPAWQAVNDHVASGESIRLEVRLVGAPAGLAMGDIAVTAMRLDMGPDGMPTMVSELRPVASAAPDIVAFEADLTMAGRYALSISANVKGLDNAVSGVVVFTIEKIDSAAPPETQTAEGRHILYYRNPMGLPDISPVPKKDAMGMAYIPVYADEVPGETGTVQIDPKRIQLSGVRTEPVVLRAITRRIRAVGTVMPDERTLSVIALKFNGFVEDLAINETGVDIRAGDPLMKIWIESPELLAREADFLVASKGRGPQAETAERNLRQFDLPDDVIATLVRTHQPVRSIEWKVPVTGTVIEKPVVEGMRFTAGDPLFKIADLSNVWIVADIPESDIGAVAVGQAVSFALRAFPNETFQGRVSLIYPQLDMQTRTVKVRIEAPNPDRRIRLGLYADVSIEAVVSPVPVIAVPETSVIDSGARQIVFVAHGDGRFAPHEVKLGARGAGYVEVVSGIGEHDEVVVSGTFLIDAQSNLQAALARFTDTPKAAQ